MPEMQFRCFVQKWKDENRKAAVPVCFVQEAVYSGGAKNSGTQQAIMPRLWKEDASIHEKRDYGPAQMFGISKV